MVAEIVEHRSASSFYEQLEKTERKDFYLEKDGSNIVGRFERCGFLHSIPFRSLTWGVGMKRWLKENM